MNPRAHDDEQGGATVEFAILTMVLVPLAIYVIYSGEAITYGIKAAEAEISAGWEATAYRVHDYAGSGNRQGLLEQAANTSATRVQERIKGFDSYKGTGSGWHGVFGGATMGANGPLGCAPRDQGDKFGPSEGPTGFGVEHLKSDGWIGCTTEVKFVNEHAVRNAHSEFFGTTVLIIGDSIKNLTMGGLGTNFRGCVDRACPRDGKRGFLVLTDDYGLEDPQEVKVGSDGDNKKYYKVGNAMWNKQGQAGDVTAAPVTMALLQMGDKGNTGTFKMGYRSDMGTRSCSNDSFCNDGGGMTLHLSPYNEASIDATKHTKNLSNKAYDKRDKDNYMSMQDSKWNKR